MNLRSILAVPLSLTAIITSRISNITSTTITRAASSMTLESGKMNVLHQPLEPHTKEGDTTHPTGYNRDGYCWGSNMDAGKHYIGGIVTQEFLQFSKDRGNDLMTRRGGFPGLKDGCRWCLCVDRWREALSASEKLGDRVVPRVDLSSTALDSLKTIKMEDLKKYEYKKPG